MVEQLARRTFQPVWHNSRRVGLVEAELWTPTDIAMRERALKAARLYELAHKQKGRRNGPLGHVGLEVLSALWSVIEFSTGRLEPSLEWIMEKTGRCRDAVVTALKRLKRAGFVTWVRRFEYVTGLAAYVAWSKANAAGARHTPGVKQATNAYALRIPPEALDLIPNRRMPEPPTPPSPAAKRQQALRALTAAQRPFRFDHYKDGFLPPLSEALKKLNNSLAERESATPVQTRSEYLLRDAPEGAGAA